jgi:hypothetical protein
VFGRGQQPDGAPASRRRRVHDRGDEGTLTVAIPSHNGLMLETGEAYAAKGGFCRRTVAWRR